MKFVYFILFLITSISCFSQDTIWFLSGERLITSNYSIKMEDGMLTYLKKNKEKKVGLEYVFSIHEKNGYEKVYYEATSIDNVPFSVEQMRSFVKGEFEASENYKANGAFLTGFVSGAGSVILIPFVSSRIFWSPVVPATVSAIVGSTNIKESKIIKKYPQNSNDEYFISGYSEIVKQKRISHSIVGGLVGLVAGISTAILINNVK